ncbi:hypothetical protein BC628DRAFT_194102 [Trametes gibbosa]|nr:hypothetical protein BC628DRAFT_194102 [Trametes gibbosa]
MLAFGLKIAWFTLSLTGLLGSFAAIPAFARSLDSYLFPVLYGSTNCVLQGLFCLGMIWKMNPFAMPRAFCIAQSALMGVSWSFLTATTTCMTIVTSLAILRPVGGAPASSEYIRSSLRWRSRYLLLVFFPMAALAVYLVLALKLDAIKPEDGLSCDTTNPVWVRLLSYSGVPLLLALPSLCLTCAAALRFYTHSPRNIRSFTRSTTNDHFTPVPLRRQSKFKTYKSWHEAKGAAEYISAPLTSCQPTQSIDQRSLTPSGTVVVEAIPSPPSSLSSAAAHLVPGRLPTAPGLAKPGTRYHLPFQWRPASDPLTERSHSSAEHSSRHTPSPLVFAMPADDNTQQPSRMTVFVTPDASDRLYDAAPWLRDEKSYLRQIERVRAWRDDAHDDDDNYDAHSGSQRWARRSEDTFSIAKSEVEFVRSPRRDDFEETVQKPFPADPSTYDAGLSDTPLPDLTFIVWRILFFQLLSSVTQILATVSSLVDMFAQHNTPVAFGTQHVALLVAAWAPVIAFGVKPWQWRREPFCRPISLSRRMSPPLTSAL